MSEIRNEINFKNSRTSKIEITSSFIIHSTLKVMSFIKSGDENMFTNLVYSIARGKTLSVKDCILSD